MNISKYLMFSWLLLLDISALRSKLENYRYRNLKCSSDTSVLNAFHYTKNAKHRNFYSINHFIFREFDMETHP